MGNTALTTGDNFNTETLEKVLIQGDLSKLSSQERLMYYNRVCTSLGLNPLTKPFDYITLNGKLTLYAKRDCTDQLRKLHDISIKITSREKMEDLYVVVAQGTNKDGRIDESTGAVSILNLRGEALANALMKAETKAKRRVTLSLAGLGWLDETETETIPNAKVEALPETIPIKEVIKPMKPPKQEVQKTQTESTQIATTDIISTAQAKRMFAIAHGDADVVREVLNNHNYVSSKDVRKADYEAICEEIQALAKPEEEVNLPWDEEEAQ